MKFLPSCTRFALLSRTNCLTAALLLALAGCSRQEDVAPTAPAAPAYQTNAVGAAGIAGVNWADVRDNFVDGWIIPTGLSTADTYSSAQATADKVVSGFQTNMGANTIRFGINPSTVLESWWGTYTGAIDQSLNKGSKVILACWEGKTTRDGRIDNFDQFWAMWQAVVARYGSNPNVYFEVFNEPHGYGTTDLTNIYAEWLGRYPSVPKGRILLGGTGYSEDLKPIGADGRFADCLLSVHIYTFFLNDQAAWPRTAAGWEQEFANRVGNYANRAVLTEYGTEMTTGTNYTGPIGGVPEIAYMQGITNYCRRAGIASVYWPGLRNEDSYSIQLYDGNTMRTTNNSGLSRIRYAWNEGDGGNSVFHASAYYRIINRNSSQVLEVPGYSVVAGEKVTQYSANGGENQQWQILDNGNGYFRIINRSSGQALEVPGYSATPSTAITQYPYNGGENQQWQLAASNNGYYRLVNRSSRQVAEVPGYSTEGGKIIEQYPDNGGQNQEWLLIQQ